MSNCYVEVCGGIGNQLFQIATGYAYSRDTNKQLIIDTSNWTASQGNRPEKYNEFFRNFQFGKPTTMSLITIYEKEELIYNSIEKYDDNVKLCGYFQSVKYFETYLNDFKRLLIFPNVNTDHIKTCSIAFHIRIGDYRTYPNIFGNIIPYFYRMFEIFKNEDIHVYTDSPDIVLSKFNNFNFKLIQTSTDLNDLTMLTKYDRIVCSNSSFSWWGAMLGNASEILVPNKWTLTVKNPDIYIDKMTQYEF